MEGRAAGDLVSDIQFSVTGQEPGEYYLPTEGDKCSFHEGKTESPQLTTNTPSEVWLAISRGKLDGQQAFMQQKYTVSGDFGSLMKLDKLFATT